MTKPDGPGRLVPRMRRRLGLAVASGLFSLGLAAPAPGQAPAPAPGRPEMTQPLPAGEVEAHAQLLVRGVRRFVRADLNFAVATCGLSAEQRRRLARDCEAMLRATAREVAESRTKVARGEWGALLAVVPSLRRQFAETLRAAVAPEQFARYAEEARLREDDRRRAAVAIMVDRLDGALALAPGQREALARSLREGWDDGWASGPEAFASVEETFLPMIPDRLVLPALEPAQAASWKAAQKQRSSGDYWILLPAGDDRPLDAEAPR